MKRTQLCRMLFLICAVLVFLAAFSVVAFVIPTVRSNIFPGSTPESAITAFWVATAFLWSLGIVFVVLALRAKVRNPDVIIAAVILSLVLLFQTLAFADARAAYIVEGPAFTFPSRVLFLCAAASFVAAAMGLIAVFLLPRRR